MFLTESSVKKKIINGSLHYNKNNKKNNKNKNKT